MAPSRIAELASIIARKTAKVDEYLQSHDRPSPSFDVDCPPDLGIPPHATEIEEARMEAIEASIELQELLQGPASLLRPIANMSSLQAISRFDIASKFPIHEEISYEQLAERSGTSQHDLKRCLRYAMTFHRVFQEPRKGFVAHTAASRLLAEDPGTRGSVSLRCDECWPACARTVDAIQEKSQEPNKTGFSLANKTNDTIYEFLGRNPSRAKRFSTAMTAFSAKSNNLAPFLVENYPWDAIGTGMVVDLGGSKGHISIKLAERYPNLRFTVQDRAQVIGAQNRVPAALQQRVILMAHDFFTPQPVKADVYLFSWIFSNWSDAYCIKILQNLMPKPGARIVIFDNLMPEPNVLPLLKERSIRATDMLMLALSNARERDMDDWMNLFKQADSRFVFLGIKTLENSLVAIIEAVWNG